LPHHGHVDHGDCDFETEVQGIKLIPVKKNQVERKLNTDELLKTMCMCFVAIEIHWTNAMAGNNGYRPEVSFCCSP
jgi:hypothetical protein